MNNKTNLLLLLINTGKETSVPKVDENASIFFNKRWQLQNVYIESYFETDMNNEFVSKILILEPKQYIIFGEEGKVKIESQTKNILLTTNFKFKAVHKDQKFKKLILIEGVDAKTQYKWEIISISNNYMIINDISFKNKNV